VRVDQEFSEVDVMGTGMSLEAETVERVALRNGGSVVK